MEEIVSIVLAAGAGKRFGGRKQLAPLAGRPLLEHALAAAAASSTSSTLLVLGADAAAIERGVDLEGASVVRCADWELGPGASLGCGLAALGPDVAAALVTLGDEPFVSPTAARRLIAARRADLPALRATYGGRPGHPVLIERRLFEPLIEAAPGQKPAVLLRAAGIETVECGDLGDPADVDTPGQLEALERARR
ncbi:MAG TPA: nucleotidyltransferase family protein [Solirubrobacterales bacterium]|nr:nucleotidyltransferase family protein [Solirubrobacterales bacterium]